MLLIDNFSGHIDNEIEKLLNDLRIDVKPLPSNTTPYLQPLDLSVNGPFKSYYADYWDDFQLKLDSRPLTDKAQNYKAPPKEDKIEWISKAWEQISQETIQNGFKCYLEEQVNENSQEELSKNEEEFLQEIQENKDDLTEDETDDKGLVSDLEQQYMNNLLDYEICDSLKS